MFVEHENVHQIRKESRAVLEERYAYLARRFEQIRLNLSRVKTEIETRTETETPRFFSEQLYTELFGQDIFVMRELSERADTLEANLRKTTSELRALRSRLLRERMTDTWKNLKTNP